MMVMKPKVGNKSATHRVRGGSGGYFIYRSWKRDPKTGEKLLPPEGQKAWKIWVSFDRDKRSAEDGK